MMKMRKSVKNLLGSEESLKKETVALGKNETNSYCLPADPHVYIAC